MYPIVSNQLVVKFLLLSIVKLISLQGLQPAMDFDSKCIIFSEIITNSMYLSIINFQHCVPRQRWWTGRASFSPCHCGSGAWIPTPRSPGVWSSWSPWNAPWLPCTSGLRQDHTLSSSASDQKGSSVSVSSQIWFL